MFKEQREALDGKVLALICDNARRLQPHRLSLSRLRELLSSDYPETNASLQRLRRRGAITFYTREGWVQRG